MLVIVIYLLTLEACKSFSGSAAEANLSCETIWARSVLMHANNSVVVSQGKFVISCLIPLVFERLDPGERFKYVLN